MRFSLRQLQVFVTTAHFENVSKAAEHLAMSQSAASGALSELEQQFNIQLFDRVGKKLKLNELGRAMRPRAESLLAQADELELAMAQHSDAGDLKVGATLTIGNYLCVGIMAKYMAMQPGSQVSLSVANTSHIMHSVLNFDLDIGMIEGELNHSDLEVTPWCDDELSVFCAPDHPLAKRKRLSEKDLITVPWILREQGSGTRQTFDRAMHGILPDLNVLLELQHTEAIKRAVEAGLGIGCLSNIALEEAFRRGSLIPLKIVGRDLKRQFYFIVHRQKYRGAGLVRWLDLCQELHH